MPRGKGRGGWGGGGGPEESASEPIVREYRQQLRALLPRGAAFPNDLEVSTLDELLTAIADSFERVDADVYRLIEEVDPRTTSELIVDWERICGLPDPGSELGETLTARRNAVVQRITTLGSLTAAFLTAQAAQLGFTITIVEYQPFEFGYSQFGEEIAGLSAWWHFDVYTPDGGVFDAEFGGSAFGEPFGYVGNEQLAALLYRIKPTHTNYRIIIGSP